MKIAILGGTGFIGKKLTKQLLQQQHELFILTRSQVPQKPKKSVHYVHYLHEGATPEKELEGIDAFINLAGHPINGGRWTKKVKNVITESRQTASREMVRIIQNLKKKPKVVLQGSAIGYYGPSDDALFTESSSPQKKDFLSTVVHDWEESAKPLEQLGIRVVYGRIGIVLDKKHGALPKIALPYSLFAGGTIGSGKQWLSWIHIDDLVQTMIFLLEKDSIQGPVNLTSPTPTKMKDFGKTLALVMKRPHWLPVPGFALKILLGEMSTLVLDGQQVESKKLQENGFVFQYKNLEKALTNIYYQ